MHTALHIMAFLLLGILLGAGYFGLLFVEVGKYVQGASARYAIMTHLLRLAAAVPMFWLVAHYGAAALLAALAGFTIVLATLSPLTTP
jgi:F1F0 ATPase subunit 2